MKDPNQDPEPDTDPKQYKKLDPDPKQFVKSDPDKDPNKSVRHGSTTLPVRSGEGGLDERGGYSRKGRRGRRRWDRVEGQSGQVWRDLDERGGYRRKRRRGEGTGWKDTVGRWEREGVGHQRRIQEEREEVQTERDRVGR
jgi:hypothetical protein